MDKANAHVISGVLELFSETGTEGGYWALQDERHITPNTTQFRCTKCMKFWDKTKRPDGPPKGVGLNDGVVVVNPDGSITSHTPTPCLEDEHDFQPSPPKWWSHEGLHILENGDHLTIFDKVDPTKIVWEGVIRLKQHKPFTEHANGMWIHADQKGVDRDAWSEVFFGGYPAQLIEK
jgi:hypothetical protein